MSEVQQWYLHCDFPGCEEMFTCEPDLVLDEGREEASKSGWSFSIPGCLDYCETHTETGDTIKEEHQREQQDEEADREGSEEVRSSEVP